MSTLELVLQFLLLGVVLVSGHFRYSRAVKYSPELMSELRDFEKLIPSATIGEIVAEHMITDSGFRKAVKFLRSSDFKRFQQRTESLPEVVDLINFVHLNDTTTLKKRRTHWYQHKHHHNYYKSHDLGNRHRRSLDNSISEELVFVLLQPVADTRTLGSFTSFVQEILTHLPRDRFVALIKEKRQKSAIFAKFYQALKSPEFKAKCEAAWTTANVQGVIKELSGHQINAQDLKAIGYEVISWGPA
ncbi:uncharacterized protein LOC110181580 [Drosophila serrata]|uniref:uncharacterized protein LOC110181580 n=1 Tax=Drosophila serrata TaxID=7274 RepID=UPI000A1D36B6|nr:uncharacterized protein LOC110181580 [Drosophila serrata]